MSTPNTVQHSITRICSHAEQVDISYRSSGERDRERRDVSGTLCSECSKKIQGFFEVPGETIADIPFPPLKGTDKQISWALKLRADAWKLYGAMLHQVMQSDPADPIVLPLYRTLLAYGAMDAASFWIDGRHFKPSHWVLKGEVAFFLKAPGFGITLGEFSPYGRLLKNNPAALDRIKQSYLPEKGATPSTQVA